MTFYYGNLLDAQTGQGIQGANITFYNQDGSIQKSQTGTAGYFSVWTTAPASEIKFTSVGYKPWTFPGSEYQHTFELERDYQTMPPVVLPPGSHPPPPPVVKKDSFMFPVLALMLVLLISKAK